MRFSDYVNDPLMQGLFIFDPTKPNEKYSNALLIDSVLDYFDAPENADILKDLLEKDLSIEENLNQVLTQMRLITTLPVPSEIPRILQMILSAGSRDQYLTENSSKYSQEEFERIVTLINTTFPATKHSTIVATPLTIKAKGPLLYPCSGSDVTYPLLLCPDVNEFYLLDQHPLFESDSSDFHSAFHRIMKNNSTQTFKIGEALGAYKGYDHTRPNIQFEYLKTQEIGLILLLRLRQLCEMDIQTLELVTDGVYKISGTISGEEKTIYYVKHDLGNNSEAYQWLQQRVSHKPIKTLLLKAFSASIDNTAITREFFEQFQQLMPLDKSSLTVISDTCAGYSGYKRNNVPDVLEPHSINHVETVPFDFGYDRNKMIVAKGEVLVSTYASIEQRQKNLSDKLQEQERRARELIIKEAVELDDFDRLSSKEKISILIENGYIFKNDTCITFILDDSYFLMERLKPWIKELLTFLQMDPRIISVKIEMMSPGSGFSHISALLKPIINALPHFSSVQYLEISAPEKEEVAFRSDESKIIAKQLLTSGQRLTHIDVQVNDGGALAFAATFNTLKNHALRSGNIRPIKTWRPATENQVKIALDSFPESSDTPNIGYKK